ncbi:hypothetical protein JOF29_004870 [Kribbella aluminosa]|uniref:Uncharacterized protein n=1 Tax=Kribbella aluminosa TaxID=416017 RepID=A0ABS4UQ38_9ACTN|nr:hypothetical protein [Kribbella aluminosa]MBP2353760.1 hypothetical protein [Kribbella aluminosa]
MDYAAYDEQEQRLVDAVMAKSIAEEDLWIEVDRLKALIPTVEPAADRQRAEDSMESLERVLNLKAPPMSDEMAAAIRVQSKAFLSKGTPDERIELLRAAMTEIGRIAASMDGAEASTIRHLNEPLAMDIEAVRIHNDPTHPGYQGHAE